MAIDTAEKRFSMMSRSLPWLKLVITDGVSGVDESERATFIDQYSGIDLANPSPGSWLTRNYWWDNL